MPEPDHAELLLDLARRDLRALGGMGDAQVFAEEIFGFHTQQVIEKSFKAWLSLQGVEYPKTHDIRLLLSLLQKQGCVVSPFTDLIEYTAFAVQFRYEALEDGSDEPVDREAVLRRMEALIGHVAGILLNAREGE
jgi:HEPN domain-containing protein